MSQTQSQELRRQVEKEIEEHGKTWCHPKCNYTFLPDAYRTARLVHGMSAHSAQHDYDCCHIFR